jgi:hypothetical protein
LNNCQFFAVTELASSLSDPKRTFLIPSSTRGEENVYKKEKVTEDEGRRKNKNTAKNNNKIKEELETKKARVITLLYFCCIAFRTLIC